MSSSGRDGLLLRPVASRAAPDRGEAAVGTAAHRRDEILRAFDLASRADDPWPKLAEPVYFVAARLAGSWPELDRSDAYVDLAEVSPDRLAAGESHWIVSTYLRLRSRGLDVRIVDRLTPDAVNVCYLDEVICSPDSHRAFIVIAQGDRLYANWGEYTLAQSPAIAGLPRTCLIDMWPQPGLIPRDASRGNSISKIGYTGAPENLASAFRTDSFIRDLKRMGIDFAVGSDPTTWHDFHDLDLHLAVRDRPALEIKTKPATKLVHSWLTGCPALLGPEPSYRYWGEDGVDYLEVRRPEDVLAAIERFRADPSLYERMRTRGRAKGAAHDEESVCRQWAAALAGPVREEFETWRRDCGRSDLSRRMRRRWQRVAAPVSRKVFFFRVANWRQRADRLMPTMLRDKQSRV